MIVLRIALALALLLCVTGPAHAFVGNTLSDARDKQITEGHLPTLNPDDRAILMRRSGRDEKKEKVARKSISHAHIDDSSDEEEDEPHIPQDWYGSATPSPQAWAESSSPVPYEHPQSKAERLVDWANQRKAAVQREREVLALRKHSTPTTPIAELQAAVAADRIRREHLVNQIEWYRSFNPLLRLSNSVRERYWRSKMAKDEGAVGASTASISGVETSASDHPVWQEAWKERVKPRRLNFERFRDEQEEAARNRDRASAQMMLAVRQSQSQRAEEDLLDSPIQGVVHTPPRPPLPSEHSE